MGFREGSTSARDRRGRGRARSPAASKRRRPTELAYHGRRAGVLPRLARVKAIELLLLSGAMRAPSGLNKAMELS
jgi:hypothetical protein